jgi:hypothetical protein
MAQKKFYCPYCPVSKRKPMAGQGLSMHQRTSHPGRPFEKLSKKNGSLPKKKKKKDEGIQFELEPIGGSATSEFDAEFRLRLVIKIDVEK